MPKTTFSKQEMTNSNFKSGYTQGRNQPIIAGVRVTDRNSTQAKSLKLEQSLLSAGYMPKLNAGIDQSQRSEMALGALGVATLSNTNTSKKSFSLLDSIDRQIELNPAIMDPVAAARLENATTTAHDKFPLATDPFYVLDEPMTLAETIEQDKAVASEKPTRTSEIAASFYDFNILNSTLTLKQFTK